MPDPSGSQHMPRAMNSGHEVVLRNPGVEICLLLTRDIVACHAALRLRNRVIHHEPYVILRATPIRHLRFGSFRDLYLLDR